LVFRGTSKRLDNWQANFDAMPQPWPPGGRVHGGFKAAVFSLWPAISLALRYVEKPTFYTGHSLGAALASLAASLRPPRALYTFGSPRVGDTGFTRTLQSVPVFRFATAHDIVTSMPPATFPFAYRHVGQAFQFPSDRPCTADKTAFMIRPAPPPSPEPSNLFRRVLRRLTRPPAFLADHAPVSYTAGLAV
jgi:predicted lipase